MNNAVKERLFKEKIIKTIGLCKEELVNRKRGVVGESTVDELEDLILPELEDLLKRVNNHQYPAEKCRYLISYANAFKVWGWNMEEPTEIFKLLAQLNREYKDFL